MKNLEKDARTGRLSYRKAYPKKLLPFIPGGLLELKVSLGATSLTECGVLEKFQQSAKIHADNVALAQKIASGAFDSIDAGTIAYIAATYVARELEADDKAQWGAEVKRGYLPRADLEQDYIDSRDMLRKKDQKGLVALWRDWGLAFAATLGYRLDPTAPPFARLCVKFGESACDLWLSIDARGAQYDEDGTERLDKKPSETPPAPTRPESAARSPTAPGDSFETIAEAILSGALNPPSVSTQQSARTALKFLRETHGPITPAALTRKAVTEWLALLAQRPFPLPKSERLLPLRDLVALYANRPDTPRLSAKTLNNYSGQIATLWRKGWELGLIDENLSDPFKGRKAAWVSRPEEPQELSRADLAAMFALPVFTLGERPTQGRGEASFWLLLMLLWTGARPEELAQLIVSDISQDAETGRWMLRITDEGEHPVKGPRSLKTSKKHSGRRTFPIPNALIALGFLDFVAWARASGNTALFPRLTLKNARRHLFPGWGEWWSKYLRLHGAFPAGLKRRASREFRHNWATAARAGGIDRETREYIQGHTAPAAHASEGERYGSKNPLGLAIDRLDYPGLDLTGVRRWTAPTP